MSNENSNELDPRFEQALDTVMDDLRTVEPDEHEVQAATERVFARLPWADATAAGSAAAETMAAEHSELRECADYQALLPAFVAGTLPDARRLLIEDHCRSCIPCRRALQSVRAGLPIDNSPRTVMAKVEPVWRRYAVAAGTVFLAFIVAWFSRHMLPSQQQDLFQVQDVDGQVFQVSDAGLVPLRPGDWIDGGDEIRTSKAGGARFELADGSRVEASGRSAFEVVRKRNGLRVRVDRGSIIVEASEQGSGTLDVVTNELLVSVKGTIFAVSHGTKGSRVSVIEGEVEVEKGQEHQRLYPGDQLGSRATMTALPFAAEIGWSKNTEQYLAMLEEFSAIRQDLNQVMAKAEPRYSTRLLDLAPADTMVYIALPNPTTTVTEVYQVIRDRVAVNPALRSWFQGPDKSDGTEESENAGDGFDLEAIDGIVGRIRNLGQHLGEETAVAVGLGTGEQVKTPVVLSEVIDAEGLSEALGNEIAELLSEEPDLNVVILDGSSTTVPASTGETVYIWVGTDLLVATTEIAEINRIAAGAASGFEASAFRNEIAEAYDRGAEYLGAVDIASILEVAVAEEEIDEVRGLEFAGIDDVQYLIVDRQQDEERAHTAAELTFSGPRHGAMSWLAQPAPMGALEFFGPDTTFVGAVVTEDPLKIFDQALGFAASEEEDFEAEMQEVEAETGINVRDDLIATLGGEVAGGIDGPTLPVPAWKFVMEVYDEVRLQQTIAILIEHAAQELIDEGTDASVVLEETTGSSGSYYRIIADAPEGSMVTSAEINYTYVDGYMVVAPTRALVEQAIQYRDGGASITTSAAFRDLLPTDSYANFSAVAFNRIGEAVAGLASKLPRPAELTAEQGERFDQLLTGLSESAGPSLYCLYGDEDGIRLVSNSPSMLPFAGLESVFGLGTLLGSFDLEEMPWQTR